MGVYIKGMEMPTSCGDCKAFVCYRQWAGDIGDCFCGITKNVAKAKEKNADCPLVPVPPHGRLGDLDEFINIKYELPNGQKAFNRGFHSGVQYVQRLIMDASTIIEAEEGET